MTLFLPENQNQGCQGQLGTKRLPSLTRGWKSSYCSPLPVEGEIFFLAFPFIDQALTRFDHWSFRAMGMSRQRPKPVLHCVLYLGNTQGRHCDCEPVRSGSSRMSSCFLWPAAKFNAGRDGFDGSAKTHPLYPCAVAIMTRSQFGGTARSNPPESFIRNVPPVASQSKPL
jgi:hypothetical protein